ncbi:MAG TPA: GNAT family N-acetyltransferase [Flavisolibacter sp.]|nr:GNAT family N-acetyltransferase [Flavisolibacter sp.]
MVTVFKTKRLYVRLFTAKDSDNFFALNGNEQVMRYIRAPKSRQACDLFLNQVMRYSEETKLFGRWAVEDRSGNFVGSFAIIPVEGRDEMQLGYSLLPPYWGLGYATELTKEAIQYVFTKTSLDPIYAYTDKENKASQNVLLKSGFSPAPSRFDGEREILGFILHKKEIAGRLLIVEGRI